jgi:hypothetical protein
MKKEDKSKHILAVFDELANKRKRVETVWKDIAALCLPNKVRGFDEDVEGNKYQPEELYDGTGVQAAEFLNAALLGGLVNPEIKWFNLNPDFGMVRESFDGIDIVFQAYNDVMYNIFRSPFANFYSNIAEMFLETICFGTGCMEVMFEPSEGIRYRTHTLPSLYMETDKVGRVDTVFRRFFMTARQAAQTWGIEALSEDIKDKLEEDPYERIEILRVVRPYDEFKRGNSKFEFESIYIERASGHILAEAKLKDFPYIISRWSKLADEVYGRSPAWSALADMNMVQAMEYSMLEMLQKIAEPPLMVADDGVLLPLETHANGLIMGGMDPVTGRPRVAPLPFSGNPTVFEAALEKKRESIRRAFFNNSLSLQNRPQMTAEEVVTLREENFRMMVANVHRIIEEALHPLVLKTFRLASEHNILPEVQDPDLADALNQIGLRIDFNGNLARTAKLQNSDSIMRYIGQFVTQWAQVDPDVLDTIDTDAVADRLALDMGVPLSTLRTMEERLQLRQARAQAQQAQFELEAQKVAGQQEPPQPDIPEIV